jgi:hypothetical protein
MVDEPTDPELTFTTAVELHKETNMEQKDGHRAYAAKRQAKLIRLAADLRGSDTLLTEFVGKPDDVATKYGLQLTKDEVSMLAVSARSQELNGNDLAAVSGGANLFDINCLCGKT